MTSSYTRGVRALMLTLLVTLGGSACGGEEQQPVSVLGPWQPTPIPLGGPILATIDRACRGSFPDFPQETSMVVVDARGGGRIDAHYAGPNGAEATCWGMSVDAKGNVVGGGGGTQAPGVQRPPLQPFELTNDGGYSSDTSSLTLGRVGSGIVRVLILSPGGPSITPSLANGWYLASIPSDWAPGAKAVGFDSSGQIVVEVPVP